jgi:hypothetical protein
MTEHCSAPDSLERRECRIDEVMSVKPRLRLGNRHDSDQSPFAPGCLIAPLPVDALEASATGTAAATGRGPGARHLRMRTVALASGGDRVSAGSMRIDDKVAAGSISRHG